MEFFFPIKKILSDFLNECDFFKNSETRDSSEK